MDAARIGNPSAANNSNVQCAIDRDVKGKDPDPRGFGKFEEMNERRIRKENEWLLTLRSPDYL